MILVIVGIFFYVQKMKGQIFKAVSASHDNDPDAIIGSNPEPKLAGKYGMMGGH